MMPVNTPLAVLGGFKDLGGAGEQVAALPELLERSGAPITEVSVSEQAPAPEPQAPQPQVTPLIPGAF